MRAFLVLALITCGIIACSVSNMQKKPANIPAGSYEDTLRYLYSLPPDQWPAPSIDSGITWQELGIIPESPLQPYMDSLENLILLGKTLFFDKRLSGSNRISCATCHVRELSWTDGKPKSIGHDEQPNKRNSPTLLNVWYFKQLFWDGRSNSLEDQAFAPINSETEMHSDMAEVMMKLRRIPGYKPLFDSAFRHGEISPETVTSALATFQRTLVSRKSNFDDFLSGNKKALNDSALRGLHLFRTKARCMNCHNGPLFSDNGFHNIGLANYQQANEDLGRYKVTRRAEDVGRFKTPSLREVMRTGPWMHNGLFNNMNEILNLYNMGMPQARPGADLRTDTLFPETDKLIRPLGLSRAERADIIAFLHAVSGGGKLVLVPKMPE